MILIHDCTSMTTLLQDPKTPKEATRNGHTNSSKPYSWDSKLDKHATKEK